MSSIVFGAGTSHTPLLTLGADQWFERAKVDYDNPALTLSDGSTLSYPQLLERAGARFADEVSVEALGRKAEACQALLDRLADDLEAARPDAVVIIGDDQRELFGTDNLPAISVFHGDPLVMLDRGDESLPEWRQTSYRGYAMDRAHAFPGHPGLALDIIRGLIERDVDVGSAARVADPSKAGFGHAYGFIIRRLFRGRAIPVVPIILNTFIPPNVLRASRAFDIGQHLRGAIEAAAGDLRVAVIASGGLSHFVVDPDLDARIRGAIRDNDAETLRALPRAALRSGSSEILNWLVAAGALHGRAVRWEEYVPLYRTPAGTGVGAAFLSWA